MFMKAIPNALILNLVCKCTKLSENPARQHNWEEQIYREQQTSLLDLLSAFGVNPTPESKIRKPHEWQQPG